MQCMVLLKFIREVALISHALTHMDNWAEQLGRRYGLVVRAHVIKVIHTSLVHHGFHPHFGQIFISVNISNELYYMYTRFTACTCSKIPPVW